MGIFIDIGVCAIFLLALVIGAVRGLCRQFSRPLVGIISIAGAIALVVVLYPLFANSSPMLGFIVSAAGWFKKPMYSVVVANAEELTQAMQGSYLSVLSGVSDKMFARMQTMLEPTGLEYTIGNFFGKIIVNIIVEFAMWLVFYLAIKYLLLGIKYLLKKVTSVVVFKSIDKIFGIIWSVSLTYVIVIGVVLSLVEMIVNQFVGGLAPSLQSWISGTTVLKLLHNTNVIGSFISGIFGWPLMTIA